MVGSELPVGVPEVFSAKCPSRVVLDHLNSTWGMLVLTALHGRTLRWSELRRSVEGISDRMLACTLRTFEADGLVDRHSFDQVPPRVEYRLTALGDDLAIRLLPLMAWVAAHATEIVDDQAPTGSS